MRATQLKITTNVKILLALYLAIFALLLGIGVLYISLTNKSVDRYNDIANLSSKKLSLLIGIRKHADYIEVATLRRIVNTDKERKKLEDNLIQVETHLTDTNFYQYQALVNSKEEEKLFQQLAISRKANRDARNQLIAIDDKDGNDNSKALEFHNKVQRVTYEKFQNDITILSDFLSNETSVKVTATNQFTSSSRTLLNLCLALVFFILVVLGYLIRLTINRLRQHNAVLNEKDKNLNKQKQLFKSVLAAAPDGIVGINDQGKIMIFNDQAEKMFGYQRKEILGQDLSILIPADRHSNHTHYVGHYFKNKVERKMGNANMDLQGLRKNGKKFPVDISLSSVETEDGLIAIAGIRDITDRKKTERQLKQLADIIENSNAFVGISNMNKTMEYANSAMKNVLGLPADFDLSTLNVTDFYSPDSVRKIKEEIVPYVLRNGKWIGQNEWINAAGKIIPVIQVIMLHLNEQGEHEYTSTTAIDISDLKDKEVELTKLATDLRALTNSLLVVREEERKAIAKDIHDELGQNLTVAKLDVSWLLSHLDANKDAITVRLENLKKITQETIDTSRKLYNSIYPQMLEDVGLVGAIKWHAANYIKTTGIDVVLKTELKEERTVNDHNICLALFRIYQECFTNILRYSKASRVVITLYIDNGNIVMSIQDDGIGFEVDRVDTKLHHGLLGMRERAFALNGTLRIYSELGIGTNTTVSIPVTIAVGSEN